MSFRYTNGREFYCRRSSSIDKQNTYGMCNSFGLSASFKLWKELSRSAKIIHQTGETKCLVPSLYKTYSAWRNLTGYQIFFHDSIGVNRLLNLDFPEFPLLRSILRYVHTSAIAYSLSTKRNSLLVLTGDAHTLLKGRLHCGSISCSMHMVGFSHR